MADQDNSSTPQTSNSYTGGLFKDSIDLYQKNTIWTHLRNGCTNLPDGQVGAVSTEPANIHCITFRYPLIGAVPLADDQWCVFLTDDTISEIGIFTESQCTYTTLTGPQTCIGLNRKHLITGAARRGFDCGFDVYWSDGRYNPDRYINTAKVPFVQVDTTPIGPCRTYVDTTVLDCEKLRLAPYFIIPCLKLAKSEGSGQLLNGSYQVAIRYVINGVACTDFVALSPIQAIWAHNNLAGAVKLSLSGTETNIFSEMEVVLVSEIDSQVEARSLGIYSTSQTVIYIDNVDLTLPIVPLAELPLNTPAIEKSDAIYSVGTYLTRVGTTTKPEPNYQLLANNIRAWWTCVEYDDKYYHRGGDSQGMNVGSMRDEVYAYYIRWVWRSGDKTLSYHIPGLVSGTPATFFFGGPGTGDTGLTIAHGRMAGYSSTEIYDDKKPSVWGPLCGLPIRHHRFPDQTLHPDLTHFTNSHTIRIMGVYFDNIALPVDNNGVVLQDIQGYEILRAVREGHKSVIAKGMVNHMRGYQKADGTFGTYQNYPYDDLHADRYLTTDQTIGTVGGTVDGYQGNEQTKVMETLVSFHSPDTSFDHPNLGGAGSLVLYQGVAGTANGSFDIPYQHPKFKLLTDRASEFGLIIGFITTVSDALNTISGGGTNLQLGATNDLPWITPMGMSAIADGSLGAASDTIWIAGLAIAITGTALMSPFKARIVQEQIMNVINGLVPAIQFARQYNSHGFYDIPVFTRKTSFGVQDYGYIQGNLQTLGQYDINNLYRNNYVAMDLSSSLPDFPAPYNFVGISSVPQNYAGRIAWEGHGAIPAAIRCDASRFTLGQGPSSPYPPGPRSSLGPFISPIVSWYGAYKVPQGAQYGQVDSTKQVPISCVLGLTTNAAGLITSPVLFGGDTYINRYTEKNPFFFFNDWLYKQPTDYIYDYTQYENVPYPRYWVNNSKVYYDNWAAGPSGSGASKNWHVDEPDLGTRILGLNLSFYLKGGYFYLFNNGVRDFYVESEVNVGYRDWEDDHSKRFYDPYGYISLDYLFRSDIIQSDILYKYDYSLSASRFFNQYLSWGKMFDREYDPVLAYTCFSYYPRRLNYSLPQDEEDKKDNWRVFLPNNYKDFPSTVTCIEDVGNSGALILMKDRSPVQFIGQQSIASSSGTDYTVGNGLLFQQTLASVSNASQSLQYGSCQSRASVINTPHGVFWVSRDTGKVFLYGGQGLQDITPGLKWHLSIFLPSQLLAAFPSYPLGDSTLMGIGIQSIYDPINEVYYICKKDYKPIAGQFTINGNASTGRIVLVGDVFHYQDIVKKIDIVISLEDPIYFDNASWTLSYDCKTRQWVSFHDWYPALNIPAKTHFLTTNSNTISGRSLWRHNLRTDLFCQYYGKDYPFEVEYIANTGVNTTTLESVQYMLDSYSYRPDKVDRFLQYFNSFDYATITNDEQSTGPLFLVEQPYNDPYATLNYPDYSSPLGIGILQSKVEGKYRFNFLKDMTADRGMFTLSNNQYWVTAANGYVRTANPGYITYLKPWQQLKKIRGKGTSIFLRRTKVQYNSLSLNFSSQRHINSPR